VRSACALSSAWACGQTSCWLTPPRIQALVRSREREGPRVRKTIGTMCNADLATVEVAITRTNRRSGAQ
jgi:hypothetical protein